MTRLIRVSSRALGPRLEVRVYVYDTREQLQAAAHAFNGNDHHDAEGLCQASIHTHDGRTTDVHPIVRLHRDSLGITTVSHEIHHASTALYGVYRDYDDVGLTHYNERFAHLHSDLLGSLVKQLYRHGYYDPQEIP